MSKKYAIATYCRGLIYQARGSDESDPYTVILRLDRRIQCVMVILGQKFSVIK